MKIQFIPLLCFFNTIFLIIAIPCCFYLLEQNNCIHERRFFHLLSDILVDPIPGVILRQFLLFTLFLCLMAMTKRISDIKGVCSKLPLKHPFHISLISFLTFFSLISAITLINFNMREHKYIHLISALFFFVSGGALITLDSIIIPINFGIKIKLPTGRFIIEVSCAIIIATASLITIILVALQHIRVSITFMNPQMVASISECIAVITIQIYAGISSLDFPAVLHFQTKDNILTVL